MNDDNPLQMPSLLNAASAAQEGYNQDLLNLKQIFEDNNRDQFIKVLNHLQSLFREVQDDPSIKYSERYKLIAKEIHDSVKNFSLENFLHRILDMDFNQEFYNALSLINYTVKTDEGIYDVNFLQLLLLNSGLKFNSDDYNRISTVINKIILKQYVEDPSQSPDFISSSTESRDNIKAADPENILRHSIQLYKKIEMINENIAEIVSEDINNDNHQKILKGLMEERQELIDRVNFLKFKIEEALVRKDDSPLSALQESLQQNLQLIQNPTVLKMIISSKKDDLSQHDVRLAIKLAEDPSLPQIEDITDMTTNIALDISNDQSAIRTAGVKRSLPHSSEENSSRKKLNPVASSTEEMSKNFMRIQNLFTMPVPGRQIEGNEDIESQPLTRNTDHNSQMESRHENASSSRELIMPSVQILSSERNLSDPVSYLIANEDKIDDDKIKYRLRQLEKSGMTLINLRQINHTDQEEQRSLAMMKQERNESFNLKDDDHDFSSPPVLEKFYNVLLHQKTKQNYAAGSAEEENYDLQVSNAFKQVQVLNLYADLLRHKDNFNYALQILTEWSSTSISPNMQCNIKAQLFVMYLHSRDPAALQNSMQTNYNNLANEKNIDIEKLIIFLNIIRAAVYSPELNRFANSSIKDGTEESSKAVARRNSSSTLLHPLVQAVKNYPGKTAELLQKTLDSLKASQVMTEEPILSDEQIYFALMALKNIKGVQDNSVINDYPNAGTLPAPIMDTETSMLLKETVKDDSKPKALFEAPILLNKELRHLIPDSTTTPYDVACLIDNLSTLKDLKVDAKKVLPAVAQAFSQSNNASQIFKKSAINPIDNSNTERHDNVPVGDSGHATRSAIAPNYSEMITRRPDNHVDSEDEKEEEMTFNHGPY